MKNDFEKVEGGAQMRVENWSNEKGESKIYTINLKKENEEGRM